MNKSWTESKIKAIFKPGTCNLCKMKAMGVFGNICKKCFMKIIFRQGDMYENSPIRKENKKIFEQSYGEQGDY